jgi:hypothetical protein
MLHDLSEGITNSYNLWLKLRAQGVFFDQVPAEDALYILDTDPNAHYGTIVIERSLAMERERCSACRAVHNIALERNEEDHGGYLDQLPDGEEDQQEEDSDTDKSCPSGNGDPHLPNMVGEYPQALPRRLRKEHEEMKEARCRPSRKANAPKPSASLITLEQKRFEIIPRNRSHPFDEYYNGPSLEDTKMFWRMGGLESQPLDWFSKPTIRSSWELFRDWGYRLEPEFALMFACETPQKVLEHILPTPPVPPQEVEDEDDPDICVMGMDEMLEYAGIEGSKDSMNLFVKGHTFDGRTVHFDPTRDSRIPRRYTLSWDIDSIIATGSQLKLLGDVDIEVLPYVGRMPPIPKSNHTYIELLMPQSQDDIDSGGRSEWFSTSHSVSTIPHTHFGTIGWFKISIHFPRMKHKDPANKQNATLIPWEVQNLFLVKVLYPAILAGENPSTMPYKNYTLDEWRWKAYTNTKFSGSKKTIVVTGAQFDAIQLAMKTIIRDNPDELGMFASHYWIMEAKGIKQHTNCVIDADEMNPYEVLCAKVPYIDFEHLQKRENGQLMMDLGLGFHPEGRDDEPLVCLWDLNKVNASYQAEGMQQGTVHHTNTMSRFGGRQSEMSKPRASLVQICFRSTYGLYYEPLRRVRGGEISFCEDVDAYNTNGAFMKSCEDYMKMLNGARQKTYGARDETRGSGAAICSVLKNLPAIVSQHCCP